MEENTSGVFEQEVAAPAPEETNEQPQQETTNEETAVETAPAAQEEKIPDKVWEAARKRAEREAKQQIVNRDRQFAERFKGFKNPVTGAPIQSEADYFAALDAQKMATVQYNKYSQ